MVRFEVPLLFGFRPYLRVGIGMQSRTGTLEVGSRAPEFLLPAANREGIVSLAGSLTRGPLIVEFLRGTW
jgi:hypothetical protein